MDHRPFEDWLLENKNLTSTEKRQLNAHMQSCPSCTALAEVDLALKSTRVVGPAAGFTGRFQTRLAAQKKALRLRNFWGFLILSIGVVSLIAWFSWPYLSTFFQSPANLLATWLSALVSLWASAVALFQGSRVLFKVIPGFIPTYVWFVVIIGAVGWSIIWAFSLKKLIKIPLGA